MRTFAFAYLHLMLICLNTWQVANAKWVGAVVVGFLISLLWTFNVNNVARDGTMKNRLLYSFGSSFGIGTGLFLVRLLYSDG